MGYIIIIDGVKEAQASTNSNNAANPPEELSNKEQIQENLHNYQEQKGNANINPSKAEIANTGIDENCDGISLIIDEDGDGWNSSIDCDDTNASVNGAATEIANNGIDEDCDGMDLVTAVDLDNDGFTNDVDCDDNNSNINPAQAEIANSGFDENCDGISLIIDEDGDGWNSSIDCDDMNASINGAATEIPNNDIDEDCDGMDLVTLQDQDGDGFLEDVDCNDEDPNINSGVEEIPNNGIDEDCDGEDLTTSIHELEGVTLRLYPNPVSDFIRIECYPLQIFDVALFHLDGTLLHHSRNSPLIDIRALPSGLYLLNVTLAASNQAVIEKVFVVILRTG